MGIRSTCEFYRLDTAFSLWLPVLSATMFLISIQPGATAENPPPACLTAQRVEAGIVRIIDSQTVETATGQRVRLAAIEAPNSIIATASGKNIGLIKRARSLLSKLTLNKKVLLVFDSGKPDRYNRRRAHILISPPGKKTHTWVQGEMIARGMARAFPNTSEAACFKSLLEIEKSARLKKSACGRTGFTG